MTTLRNNRFHRSTHALLSFLIVLFAVSASAEDLTISDESIVNTGHHIFVRSCAVCHGQDAKGNGAYAPLLVVVPPDLTTLARRNNGFFPFDRAFETISGNELMPAHGSREMPIWGQEFAHEAETLGVPARTLMRGRILELIAYLAHIQQP